MTRWVLLFALSVPAVALGDVVQLKDGKTLEGSIQRVENGWAITLADGSVVAVQDDQVASIERVGRGSPAELVDARLKVLKRDSLLWREAAQGVDAYKKLVQELPQGPALEEAKAELAIWQDRVDRGMRRFAGKWVTAAEEADAARALLAQIDGVLRLAKASRFREADARLNELLADDPTSAPAWYLRGWLLFQQDRIPEARRAFEKVVEVIPEHGPAHNNIAVTAMRQRQPAVAMKHYDLAMAGLPNDKTILDNVTEGYSTLSADQREAPPAQRVVARFTVQDKTLQQQMAAQGQFRWGGSWVSKDTLDGIRKQEAELQRQASDLERQARQKTSEIRRVDLTVAANERTMSDLDSARFWHDPGNKRYVIVPRPAEWYRLSNQNEALVEERKGLERDMELIQQQFATLNERRPKPEFTGRQVLYGLDGTPLPRVEAPTTRP